MKVGTKYSSMFIHTVKPLYTGVSLYRNPPITAQPVAPNPLIPIQINPFEWEFLIYQIFCLEVVPLYMYYYIPFTLLFFMSKIQMMMSFDTAFAQSCQRKTNWSMFQMDEHNQFKNIL